MKLVCMTLLPLALQLVPAARGQGCIDKVLYANYTQRTGGNTVFSYAEEEITGPDALTYWLTLSTQFYQNTTQLYSNQAASSQGGGGVWTEYSITLQSTGPGTFTLNSLNQASSDYCGIQAPPYSDGWNGYATSGLAVQQPSVSSASPPMFLNGAASSGTQTAVSALTANPNGAPATSTITWRFLAGSSYGTVTCVEDSGCAQANYTATAPGSACGAYDVRIVASFDGFDSTALWIFNNAPQSVFHMWGGPWDSTNPWAPTAGWQTTYTYKVLDMCSQPINYVQVNETFGSSSEPYPGGTWCLPSTNQPGVPDTCGWAWGSWSNASQFDQYGQFVDYLFEINKSGKYPPVIASGQNWFDESASSNVVDTSQFFYAGSPTNGQGVNLNALVSMTHYLDHGKSVQ